MNTDKTEFIVFGSKARLNRLHQEDLSLHLESVAIKRSKSVRDLGVQLDFEQKNAHTTKQRRPAFFHLRRLRQLKRFADETMLQRLVTALILSRIDYGNVVLAGLSQSTIVLLHRVINATVGLMAVLGPRDHITENLKVLHWLPVQYHNKFKLCVMIHSVVNGTSCIYINDLVTATRETHARSYLRSTGDNYVPRFNTEFEYGAFSVAAPS